MEKQFGYCRVSSTSQSLERQIQALLDYGIEERNIIVDKQSGKDFNRTGYMSLKNSLLRSGDTLVLKELDRLGRNKQMIKEELEWFRANNIRVKILDVPTTLMECGDQSWVMEMISNILIEVMASMAEEERIKIHSRQAEGIAIAKNKGVVFGRPKVEIPDGFFDAMHKLDNGSITATRAIEELGIKRTTFYKFRKLYKEGMV